MSPDESNELMIRIAPFQNSLEYSSKFQAVNKIHPWTDFLGIWQFSLYACYDNYSIVPEAFVGIEFICSPPRKVKLEILDPCVESLFQIDKTDYAWSKLNLKSELSDYYIRGYFG